MTKEQIRTEIQQQTSFDKLYSFWKDPRERFNNTEINKIKKNKRVVCLISSCRSVAFAHLSEIVVASKPRLALVWL